MWFLWTAAALAADLEHFAWHASVDLTACESCATGHGVGVYAVPLPVELRSKADPPDGSDLLILNAQGQAVPFAIATEAAAQQVPVRARPTADPAVWHTSGTAQPIDGLVVTPPSAPWAATVTVAHEVDGEWQVLAEELLFRHVQGSDETIHFSPTTADLQVRYRHHVVSSSAPAPVLTGLVQPTPAVRAAELEVPVSDAQLREDGWALYTVELPHELPVQELTLQVTDELFRRNIQVRSDLPGPYELPQASSAPIQRVTLGDTRISLTTVPVPNGLVTDELLLFVEARGKPALHIPSATVRLLGKTLLLQDPGPGPLTIYGGAPAGTRAPRDLQVAQTELQRLATRQVSVGAVAPNPAFVPVEQRSGLTEPGTVIEVADWAFERSVSGHGLVRLDIPMEVMGQSRSDLGDLRLVTEAGNQVPYVLHQRALHRRLPTDYSREEQGSLTRIRVRSPHASALIAEVSLSAEAGLFHRGVTVYRARGAQLEPLRTASWSGKDRPGRLTLALDEPVGRELVIEIENGDNPPLDLTGVQLAVPDWELVAVLPEQTRLLYGNPRAVAPSYELRLVAPDVLRRATETATLGPERALAKPPLRLLHKVGLYTALTVMVLVLLGMVVQLAREEDVAPAAQEDDAVPPSA